MIDMFQTMYDAALFYVGAFVASCVLRRRLPRVFSAALFLIFPVLMEMAFFIVPPLSSTAVIRRALKELLFLSLIMIVFRGKFFQKVFVFFMLMSLAALFNIVSGCFARLIFASGPGYYLCRHLIAWGFLVLCLVLFLRFGRKPAGDILDAADKLNWLLYALGVFLPYLSAQTALTLFTGENAGGSGIYLVNVFTVLGSLFVVLMAIFAAVEKAAAGYELHLIKEVIASGADYYKRLERILQEIRVLRHDYKYQMGVIDELAKINKARHILNFLAGARAGYNQTEPMIYCENLVINALLVNYAGRFEKKGVSFQVRAILPAEIPHVDKTLSPLDNYEICIVLGNLLENAFEGTMMVPVKMRRVSFEIRLMAEKLLIKARNTFDGQIMADKGQPFIIPLSRKGTEGGYGLRSVAAVCKRHDGEYLPQWTGNEYTVHLLLNL
jgi:sensor histidine kinase YesM